MQDQDALPSLLWGEEAYRHYRLLTLVRPCSCPHFLLLLVHVDVVVMLLSQSTNTMLVSAYRHYTLLTLVRLCFAGLTFCCSLFML